MRKVRRIIAAILSCSLLLSACTSTNSGDVAPVAQETESVEADTHPEEAEIAENTVEESTSEEVSAEQEQPTSADTDAAIEEQNPDFYGLNDPALIEYVEDYLYSDLVAELGTDYVIDDISAVYISKDYIEELSYNSKSNIYFGYTLEDIESAFSGTKYIFTLGDDGTTVVQPFEDYDDTFEQVVKNVAIGTGVILVCVTVSAVTGGLGAPAVSMIFAASAKSAAEFAIFSGIISTAMTAAVTGYQTKDWEQTLKAAALSGSESFKWGAMTGAATGAALESLMLRIAASGGLTMNEVALILQQHELPAGFLKQIHSMEEYYELLSLAEKSGLAIEDMAVIWNMTRYPLEIVKLIRTTEEGTIYFEQAELVSVTVNNQYALVRVIDLTYESDLAGETVTNLERMRQGYAAIDPLTGEAYQLHHIGQSVDSPLAILTRAEHMSGGNNSILHDVSIADGQGVHSILSDAEWAAQREDFWRAFAEVAAKGGIK